MAEHQCALAFLLKTMFAGHGALALTHARSAEYSFVYFFFFNGLSFHLSVAFASHLLGYNMSWGITSKARAFCPCQATSCSVTPRSEDLHGWQPCRPQAPCELQNSAPVC